MTWLIGGLQSIDANQQRLESSGYLQDDMQNMLISAAPTLLIRAEGQISMTPAESRRNRRQPGQPESMTWCSAKVQ
jgi:hypothetical protein